MCEIMNWVLLVLFGICGIRDFRKREIPVWWLVLISVLVVVFILLFDRTRLMARLVGGLLGLFFFFISKCTKEAIGYGDSWLILILGIYLGSFEVLQVLFWATILAAIVALFLLCQKRCKRNITIPFVPYLAVAFLGVVCI